MASPEWSPNESCLAKLERLAYALVRKKPLKEQYCEIRRSRNVWLEKSKGLAGPFSLALLVAIPYIAENSSGPIIVASLLLAALDACLTVWCYTDFETQHGHCSGDLYSCCFQYIGECPAFLVGWWWISALCAGFSACARSLSSILDAVTGGHVETLMENTVGSFTPFGSPIDIVSIGVITVPSIMCSCSLGMEDSNFLRSALFVLTSTTTLSIFGYAVATNHLFPSSGVEIIPPMDGNYLYAKIISGGALACVGFLGLYTVSRPDNLTLTQHKHFHVSKRFSLSGCLVACAAFLVYFIESSVINKVQQTPSLWDGDPPLLWPLDGGWRLIVASLGITALSLTTFEFLIPLSIAVTKMANDGLLYRKLKSPSQDDLKQWSPITPLLFGAVSALQSMFIDTKVLLGLVSSSLMCIHIVVCCSMIATRYQVRHSSLLVQKRAGHIKTRGRSTATATTTNANMNSSSETGGLLGGSNGVRGNGRPNRRMLAVSFLQKGGLGKLPREVIHEIEVCGPADHGGVSGGSGSGCRDSRSGREDIDATNSNDDRACLMQDIHNGHQSTMEQTRRRESVSEFSLGSNVSGYESDDAEQSNSEGADDTDIEAVINEYQENVRVATLNGVMPMFPTPATGRRVALSLIALVPCCLAMAASLNRSQKGQFIEIMLGISSGLLTFLLLVVISRQPQRRRMSKAPKIPSQSQNCPNPATDSTTEPPPTTTASTSSSSTTNYCNNESENYSNAFIPWVPAGAVFLHCCILLQGLDLAATSFAFWLAIGLIIYFSYSVTKSVAADRTFSIPTERIQRLGTPRQSLMTAVVCGNAPSSSTTCTTSTSDANHIDTVLLA